MSNNTKFSWAPIVKLYINSAGKFDNKAIGSISVFTENTAAIFASVAHHFFFF